MASHQLHALNYKLFLVLSFSRFFVGLSLYHISFCFFFLFDLFNKCLFVFVSLINNNNDNNLLSVYVLFKMTENQSISFNNHWLISTTHGSILPSEGSKRQEYEEKLATHHLPDMIFDTTTLKIVHRENQLEILFNAFDALKQIDMYNNIEQIPKVSMSEIWSKSRSQDRQLDYVKPYDWTYTTRYRGKNCNSISLDNRVRSGTLASFGEHSWRIESTDQQLDLEKLKRQEPILFYDELTLYEDELADNGMSTLTLKIRCMPSGFFILLRFFMRVDGVLIRCFDTRYHYEIENDYILREYLERESPMSATLQSISDVNAIIAQLKVNVHQLEKLFFSKNK